MTRQARAGVSTDTLTDETGVGLVTNPTLTCVTGAGAGQDQVNCTEPALAMPT